MTIRRLFVLALGPPLLIGGAYALSHPGANRQQVEFAARVVQAETRTARYRASEHESLTRSCTLAADELGGRLPDDCTVLVRTPFVIAGDSSESELDRLYATAIQPVTEALWRTYFDQRPDRPVVIVALRNETSYRNVARILDGYEPSAYAGYTQRGQRRIVLNAGTGAGTLTHELAHVLALFDFPEMPEWFDEGLAALHEEAEFAPDGLTMIGRPNWRSRLLRESLTTEDLPSLSRVIRTPSFRGEGENLNYALVRSFCLYLQERGLLAHFYRKFRMAVDDDPSGLLTLCELLGVTSHADIDRDFRAWLAKQPRG